MIKPSRVMFLTFTSCVCVRVRKQNISKSDLSQVILKKEIERGWSEICPVIGL